MHGATFYSVVLGASRVCMDKPFFNNVRPNFGQLSFTLLFSISATSMRISAILWYSVCSEPFCFHRHAACLEANACMRYDAWTGQSEHARNYLFSQQGA